MERLGPARALAAHESSTAPKTGAIALVLGAFVNDALQLRGPPAIPAPPASGAS